MKSCSSDTDYAKFAILHFQHGSKEQFLLFEGNKAGKKCARTTYPGTRGPQVRALELGQHRSRCLKIFLQTKQHPAEPDTPPAQLSAAGVSAALRVFHALAEEIEDNN